MERSSEHPHPTTPNTDDADTPPRRRRSPRELAAELNRLPDEKFTKHLGLIAAAMCPREQ